MIVYLAAALRDLRRVSTWYKQHRPAYEDSFFARLRVTIRFIEEAPDSFPVVLTDLALRRARVLRSPYFVAFVVVEREVHIVAVMHGARDPDETKRRLKQRTDK